MLKARAAPTPHPQSAAYVYADEGRSRLWPWLLFSQSGGGRRRFSSRPRTVGSTCSSSSRCHSRALKVRRVLSSGPPPPKRLCMHGCVCFACLFGVCVYAASSVCLPYSLINALTHSLTHWLTHSLSHSLTHIHTYSLSLSLSLCGCLQHARRPTLASLRLCGRRPWANAAACRPASSPARHVCPPIRTNTERRAHTYPDTQTRTDTHVGTHCRACVDAGMVLLKSAGSLCMCERGDAGGAGAAAGASGGVPQVHAADRRARSMAWPGVRFAYMCTDPGLMAGGFMRVVAPVPVCACSVCPSVSLSLSLPLLHPSLSLSLYLPV
jgi:hypothetical protein